MKYRLLSTLIGAVSLGFVSAASAAPVDVVVNGGFESGDFTGWSVTGTNFDGGGCDQNWTVGTSGSDTGCFPAVADPIGTFAAYNSWDGDGPQVFGLEQIVSIGAGSAVTAHLYFSTSWTASFGGLPRDFVVSIDGVAVPGVVPGTIFGPGDSGGEWIENAFDVSTFLTAGSASSLRFDMHIPETFTGPAGFGLDDVALFVEVTSESVPAPGALALLGLGLLGLGMRRRTA